jgi:GT2 family glycosyltransferase
MTLPRIGIVCINYKDYAARFLADCIESLRRTDYPKDRFTVYIVDNATTPETLAAIRGMAPEAIVIPHAENAGWGGANNVGAQRAFADGCSDVVFLNMDTIAEPGWLRVLVDATATDSHIAIVQAKLLLHPVGADGIPRVNSLGNALHFLGFGFCWGYGQPDDGRLGTAIMDIGYASGAAMYVRGSVFRDVGGCNGEYFMYHDDLELCLKAKLAGFRVVLAPRSVVWHKYEFARSVRQVYWMERNRLRTLLEFYRWPTLLFVMFPLLVMELGVLGAGIVGGYAGAKVRSSAYFCTPSAWRSIRTSRRHVQRLRTIPDRVLLRDAVGTIDFQEVRNPILAYVVNPILAAYWWVVRRMMWW